MRNAFLDKAGTGTQDSWQRITGRKYLTNHQHNTIVIKRLVSKKDYEAFYITSYQNELLFTENFL